MSLYQLVFFQVAIYSFQPFCEITASLPLPYSQPLSPFVGRLAHTNMNSQTSKSDFEISSTSIKKHVPDGLSFARLLAIPFFISSFINGQVDCYMILFCTTNS